MPELPEAERARQTLESALGRRIVAVDDRDSYVCRPHRPGELADALTGHTLATAHRRGKFMWLETDDGPALGLHLGMAGRIVVDPEDASRWDRFALEFADGGRMVLRDKRRLGRAILNPDFAHVGPERATVTRSHAQRSAAAPRTGARLVSSDLGPLGLVLVEGDRVAVRVLEPGELGRPRLHHVADGARVVLEDDPPTHQLVDELADARDAERRYRVLGLDPLGPVVHLQQGPAAGLEDQRPVTGTKLQAELVGVEIFGPVHVGARQDGGHRGALKHSLPPGSS